MQLLGTNRPHPIPLKRVPCAPHGTSSISSRPPASEPHEPSIGPPAAARPRPASEPIRAHRPTGSSSQPPGQRAPSAPIGPPSAPARGHASEPHEPSIGPPTAAASPRPVSPIRAHRHTGSSSQPPASKPHPSQSAQGQHKQGQASQTKQARQGGTAAGQHENPKTPEPQNPRI